MSKRCCAKNCFNSILYNKNISYFSFPKNEEFAQRWAELAGRNDLKEKPLSRIVKYYLCSEHFTANCFVDKDTRQTLKRNLPHSIALPTIFKNNLQETMQNANPRHSIEVHNIVLLDVDKKMNSSYSSDNQSATEKNVFDWYSEKCVSAASMKTDDFLICDEVENQSLDICVQPSVCGDREETTTPISPKIAIHSAKCRLCFKEFESDEPVVKLAESLHLKEFIGRVMFNQISLGDDMSQLVCKNCENNALLCLIIIQQMDETQEKMALQIK